jgi:multidrug efflux system membrane fusion protein
VIKADGTAEMHVVRVTQRFHGEATISDGVAGGDKVVTDGQLRLVPGAKVAIRAAQASQGGAPAKTAEGGVK